MVNETNIEGRTILHSAVLLNKLSVRALRYVQSRR